MRILVLLLTVVLVSCATPKTEPNSFYSGVYVPGEVVIESGGTYRSSASVFAKKDAVIARKAAYARLLLKAKEAGYAYFSVAAEDQKAVIGTRFTIAGKLFRKVASDAAVYPVDAIKRLLQDLPIRTLKEIAEDRRRKLAAEAARKQAAAQKQPARQSAVRRANSVRPASSAAPQAEPVPASTVPEQEGGPVIIMAPQDITGSIRKPAGERVPASRPAANAGATQPAIRYDTAGRPQGVSGIPAGVYLQRN